MVDTTKNVADLKIYSHNDLESIHEMSIFHRKFIKSKNHLCGCFCCLKLFDSSKIIKWADNKTTAICPYCHIDSVIYHSDAYPLTIALLLQMQKKYFGSCLKDTI